MVYRWVTFGNPEDCYRDGIIYGLTYQMNSMSFPEANKLAQLSVWFKQLHKCKDYTNKETKHNH